jgi:hypothetical protein
MHKRTIVLFLPLLLAGCTLDSQFTVTPQNLAPVMVEKPKTMLGKDPVQDVKVEVKRICRGERGGVMLVAITNTGGVPFDFHPNLVGLTLSSGFRNRFMSGTEFEAMCTQFGGAKYGIREEDEEAVAQWSFPEDDAQYKIEPGQKKEIALSFGARPEEAWLQLNFAPAVKRGVASKGTLLIAVALPDVLPPQKSWLPEWLRFNVALSNAG